MQGKKKGCARGSPMRDCRLQPPARRQVQAAMLSRTGRGWLDPSVEKYPEACAGSEGGSVQRQSADLGCHAGLAKYLGAVSAALPGLHVPTYRRRAAAPRSHQPVRPSSALFPQQLPSPLWEQNS